MTLTKALLPKAATTFKTTSSDWFLSECRPSLTNGTGGQWYLACRAIRQVLNIGQDLGGHIAFGKCSERPAHHVADRNGRGQDRSLKHRHGPEGVEEIGGPHDLGCGVCLLMGEGGDAPWTDCGLRRAKTPRTYMASLGLRHSCPRCPLRYSWKSSQSVVFSVHMFCWLVTRQEIPPMIYLHIGSQPPALDCKKADIAVMGAFPESLADPAHGWTGAWAYGGRQHERLATVGGGLK